MKKEKDCLWISSEEQIWQEGRRNSREPFLFLGLSFRAALLGPKIKSCICPAHFPTILISHKVLQSHFPPRRSLLVISAAAASEGPASKESFAPGAHGREAGTAGPQSLVALSYSPRPLLGIPKWGTPVASSACGQVLKHSL